VTFTPIKISEKIFIKWYSVHIDSDTLS